MGDAFALRDLPDMYPEPLRPQSDRWNDLILRRQRLVNYGKLWDYTCELYQVPGVAGTVDLEQIKEHYYRSHTRINPGGIIPLGPTLDYSRPHGREILGKRDDHERE